MDGNGRWATKRGLKRTDGHAAGEEALFDTVEGALELGLRWLTVYAFSTENWRRPVELHDRGVRVRFAGRRDWRVPRRLLGEQDETIALTRNNRRLTLTFAFN